jgi:hypothetical protein
MTPNETGAAVEWFFGEMKLGSAQWGKEVESRKCCLAFE